MRDRWEIGSVFPRAKVEGEGGEGSGGLYGEYLQ